MCLSALLTLIFVASCSTFWFFINFFQCFWPTLFTKKRAEYGFTIVIVLRKYLIFFLQIKELLSMMGLNPVIYWLVHYIFDYTLYMIVM